MDFAFTKEEENFRTEIASFAACEVTEELIREYEPFLGFGPHGLAFLRRLGAKRWLAPSLPIEYGGMGATNIQRLILNEELMYHRGQPAALFGVQIVAPALLHHGSEEQKKEYLPRIASGEIEFAVCFTEPEAGSDLASLRTRAERDGDDFIINGEKMFITAAHYGQYLFLAARTDPNAPKHKGVSLFIVDIKAPGVTVKPIWSMDGERTNNIFFDNVRVPIANLIGEANKGFHYLNTALAYERIIPAGKIRRLLDDLIGYVRETDGGRAMLAKYPSLRERLAQLAVDVEIARLLSYRSAWLADNGITPDWQAPMGKLFTSELEKRVAELGIQILGLFGPLCHDSKWAQLRGEFEHFSKVLVRHLIGGGTSEINRNVIAMRGLGLPRSY